MKTKINIILFFIMLFCKNLISQEACNNMTDKYYHSFNDYYDYEHGSWELIFEDNFDDSIIDRSKWHTCIGGWNREHGDTELQYYLDGNVIVDNGILKLTSKEEPGYYDVWRFNSEGSGYLTTKFFRYTSGWIQTKTKFQYGLFEVRCKIPNGQGFWPAFWLFGNGEEIDIFEFASNEQDIHRTTIHKWYNNGDHEFCPDSWENNDSFANNYHTFSLEWDEFVLIFRVDGVIKRVEYSYYNVYQYNSIINDYYDTEDGIYVNYTLFPENPQSIILNLAIPGTDSNYGEPPSEQTIFPSSLDIDYVRVYKKNNISRNISINNYNSSYINYYTGKTINITDNSNIVIDNNEHLELIAYDEVVLNNGFEVNSGGYFNARISSHSKRNENQTKKNISDLYNSNNIPISTMNTTETYPNPSDGLFNIKLSQHPENYKQINIYDIYGNKVFHKDNIYEHVITIDFSDKHGIYIIEFILLDKIEFSRIIVK